MKPGQFSFLGDEFENLFHYSDLFLPGIEKITGIYYSPVDKVLKGLSRKREEEIDVDYDELFQNPERRIMIQKFRGDGKNILWIKKEELPFEFPSRQQSVAVPTIFSELENIILVLKFLNDHDGLNDLLFIYFNKNLGNFGISRSDKPLSAENKSIIGYLLYHQFRSILVMNRKNMRLLQKFNQGIAAVIRSNHSLKEQLRLVQMNYSESMVNLAQQYLSEYSSKQECSYVFTQESLEKIRNFQGNVRHLPAIINNAIIFTDNLLLQQGEEIIKIHDFALDFDSYQVHMEESQLTRKIDSRVSKASLLLDKLEKATSSLKSRSLPLTGFNVGKTLNPPISAPAITDALAKNKVYIRQLITQHPDKWETIRKEFKPLLNVLKDDIKDDIRQETA